MIRKLIIAVFVLAATASAVLWGLSCTTQWPNGFHGSVFRWEWGEPDAGNYGSVGLTAVRGTLKVSVYWAVHAKRNPRKTRHELGNFAVGQDPWRGPGSVTLKSADLSAPAWFLLVLFGSYPAVRLRRGVRRWRRGKRGLCWNCGYSLYGLMVPRCPECGRGIRPGLAAAIDTPPADLDGEWSGREKWLGRGVAVIFTLVLIAAVAVAAPSILKHRTTPQVPDDPGRRAYRLSLSAHRLCTACGIGDPGTIDSLIDGVVRGGPPPNPGFFLEMIDALWDPQRSEDQASACGQCAGAILAAAAASPLPSDVPVWFNPQMYSSPPSADYLLIDGFRSPDGLLIDGFRSPDGRVVPDDVLWEVYGPFPSSDQAVGPEPDG